MSQLGAERVAQDLLESIFKVATALVRGERASLLQRTRDAELVELAETDALTRLFNRRHFDRRLDGEVRRAQRTGEPLALLVIDVNSFKQINDRLGHRVGDEVLRLVADAMRRSLRTYDIP